MSVILFGYYGFNNVGDEKLLDETVRMLHDVFPDPRFVIASGPTSIPFPTFNRWNLFLWILFMSSRRTIVFGGGSVFQSQSSFMSLLYYVLIVQLAGFFRCRVILLCHGWGPFKRPFHERLARYVLSKKHVQRSWRDQLSKQHFQNMNDNVFSDLTLFQSRSSNSIASTCLNPQIGYSLLPTLDPNVMSSIEKQASVSTIQIVNQPISSVRSNCLFLDDVWDDPQNIRLMITQRFHSAIWSAKFGIPWIAISHDPKLIALAHDSNQQIVSPDDSQLLEKLFHFIDAHSDFQLNSDLKDWYDSFYSQRQRVTTWLHDQLSN